MFNKIAVKLKVLRLLFPHGLSCSLPVLVLVAGGGLPPTVEAETKPGLRNLYKTAAWARANVNEGLFVYLHHIIHRTDIDWSLVLPAPYEIYPYFFVNSEVIQKLYVVKMKEGKLDPKLAPSMEFTWMNYESQFLEYVHEGQFKGYGDVHIDLKKPEAINFVGNYWQSNPDAFNGEVPKHYNQYYEVIARVLLEETLIPLMTNTSALLPLRNSKLHWGPSVLATLQTHLILLLQYKQYFEPYTKEQLDFPELRSVKVDKLVTFYDYLTSTPRTRCITSPKI
ncbi:Sex-specific storage-protein 2 [Eumeta japonica]|uniref:Sex-specific storage-protein 2 n=1 Tax=Eumeta variegata TaxID=151549 RepID=A0A4C1SLW7_EUMVA|nr:Sex-specific storage-protein 2 [Eumeta japonica]